MAFHLNRHQAGATIGEINMIPMIDVMLVLLVIVLVAAPLLTHAIRADLPQATSSAEEPDPRTASLDIAPDGTLRVNDAPVAAETLENALRPHSGPGSTLRVLANPATPYDAVAKAMAAAGRAGIASVSFVTLPGASR